MKGFGIAMTEAQARALSHEPQVVLVEEDSELEISDSSVSSFSLGAASSNSESHAPWLRNNILSNSGCPWSGGYYVCSYANDSLVESRSLG